MKTKPMMFLAGMLFLTLTTVFAFGAKTEKIKVYGNCGMCKTRIEKAAHAVKGVAQASWDKTDGILTVTFDEAKTSVSKIEEAMAKVGHDTDHFKADDKTYDKLPGCCQYDRPAKK